MTQQLEFRRIVMGLPYGKPNHGVRLAAELARMLQLDLLGVFIEDENLRNLAALPFVREFQLLGGGWRPLILDQLSRDMEIAAKHAERAFVEASKTLQTACQFEVIRGTMADTIISVSCASDIVLITEPTTSVDHATPHFHAMLDAAFRSAAAVLLVPDRIARQTGPIMAIAASPHDASVPVASTIAAAAGEDLIIVETYPPVSDDGDRGRQQIKGLRSRRITAPAPYNATAIASALQPVRERLITMTRSEDNIPLSLLSARQVPILIVEPPKEKSEPN